MANEKLNYDQIADERDILKPLTKSVENVVEALKEMEKEFKTNIELANEIAQTKAFKNVKDINDVENAIEGVTKASRDLDKIEKQRLKLEERLKDLNDERIKDNFELQEQIRQQTKTLRDQAKEANNNRNAYQELTKQVNEAQAEFKKLAAEQGTNSKAAKKAQEDFNRLNDQLEEINKAAKDGRRNVGRYADGIEEAGKKIGKAALIVTVILEAFSKLRDIVSANTTASAQFDKILGAITITLQVLVNRAVDAFPALLDLFTSFFKDVQDAASDWATNIQKSFFEATNVAGIFDEQIAELDKKLNNTSESFESTSDAASRLAKAFSGTGDEIVELVEANNKLIDLTIAYRKEIIELNKENAELIQTQTEIESRASDATTSLQDQIKANQELLDINQQINDNNIKIAQKEFELATKRAEINKANLDLQEEAAAAFVALETARAEAQVQRFDTLREISQLEQDLIEQQLDILFDDADTRKTINEQIIADETKTFETRKRALQENLNLAEETFNAQTDLINGSLQEQGKAIIDFTELSNVESEKEITERLKNAGLSEILTTRALELLRERRLFLQDNTVAQRELNEAERESNEIAKDIISQEEALEMLRKAEVDSKTVLEQLDENRLQNDIENLQFRLSLAEEGSAERLNIQQELNDKLIEQEQKRIDKEKELNDEAREARIEAFKNTSETLAELQSRRTEQQIEELDKVIAKEEERASELRNLAAQGNQDAQRNLAQQQQRQAQLEQQRKRALERQKRDELFLTGVQTFNALLEAGESVSSALVKTPASLNALGSILEALPIFHTGTEKTVAEDIKSGNGALGNNEYLSILQGGEKVFNEQHSAMIPKGMSNYDVVLAARSYDRQPTIGYDDSRLYNAMKENTKAIENKKVNTHTNYNSILQGFEEHFEQKGRLERRITKKKGLNSKI